MAITSFSGEYSFLSNFYPAKVKYGQILYPTVEHAYQAAKTLDLDTRQYISQLPTPGKAKRAGKNVMLRLDWGVVRLKVMDNLLRKKFKHPELATLLLNTVGEDLIEVNTWGDHFFGVCDDVGANHLGKLLMVIRSELVLL